MQNDEYAVFISYASGGEQEEIVNRIEQTFQKRGIRIICDKCDLGYKGSISEFIDRIEPGNCVIVVISDKYLRSPSCMFEFLEIADREQIYDRVFPIVLNDANIYNPTQRVEYVKYWEMKRAQLTEAIKTLDSANLQGIREDMDLYDRIQAKISGLTSILKDMNTPTPDMLRASDFSDLCDAIEKRMKESSQTYHKEESKSGESAKTTNNVSASNNSVSVGEIRIGGNVSGNITVGNNNQSNSK